MKQSDCLLNSKIDVTTYYSISLSYYSLRNKA